MVNYLGSFSVFGPIFYIFERVLKFVRFFTTECCTFLSMGYALLLNKSCLIKDNWSRLRMFDSIWRTSSMRYVLGMMKGWQCCEK